jgi:O-antigen ligase
MQDAAEIRGRKRRANRAVLIGVCLMAAAMLVSSLQLAPTIATTVVAIVGFGLLSYGVHVAWLVFYDREPEGPSS